MTLCTQSMKISFFLLLLLNITLQAKLVTWTRNCHLNTERFDLKFHLFIYAFQIRVSYIQRCLDLTFQYRHNGSVANANDEHEWIKMIEASDYVVETQTRRRCMWWNRNIWYSVTTTVKHKISNELSNE